ncbi:MAG: WD40 repeat domain-containing protein [Gemmataceae bacterium]|nr:WD40 repeat domain-containing protein [Gemmataceae bacterium]
MFAPRFFGWMILVAVGFACIETRTEGQGTPKAKPKPGAPLVGDPNDLAKIGSALSPVAMVPRPSTLKGIRAWSIESKKHRWSVDYLSVRPDGRKLATSGHDGIVRIWDTESGTFERALMGHEGRVSGLAWSPDGKYLASAGYYTARVWDGATGLPVRVLRGKYGVSLVAWSPDGTKLMTGGGGSGQIAIWDVAANKMLADVEYGQPVGSIAFSPDGENVAAAASRAGTYIADSLKLKTVHVFKDVLDTDYAVGFSPDGKQLAAGSVKQTVIYNVDSGAVIKKIMSPGYALTWTPKASLILAGTSYLLTPYAPGELLPGKPLDGGASVLALQADGTNLFGLYGGQVIQWDLEKGTKVQTITVGEFMTVTAGPSTSVLVPTATPALWDAVTGKKLGGLDAHKGGIVASAWGPTGKTLAVAAADKKIRVYDPATAKELRTLTAPAYVSALSVSADGKVAASTIDKKVVLWPAMGDQPLQTLTGFSHVVRILAWARDGRLISTLDGNEITTWMSDTGKNLKTVEHPRPVHSLIWSTDHGRLVVGSSEEYVLSAYQASTWKIQQPVLEKGTSAFAAVTSMWSPDGTVLLGYRNSTIQQWDGKTGRLRTTVGSSGHASTIAYWQDGKTVVGGCIDRAARYWDSATGRFRMTMVVEGNEVFAVNAEGHYRIPETIESEVIVVAMTDKIQESLSLKDFATKYGFRNVTANVK